MIQRETHLLENAANEVEEKPDEAEQREKELEIQKTQKLQERAASSKLKQLHINRLDQKERTT